jgi:hypothetical protein
MTEFFTPKGKGGSTSESGRFSRPGPVSIYRVLHDRVTASSRPCHHGESHEVARSGEALPGKSSGRVNRGQGRGMKEPPTPDSGVGLYVGSDHEIGEERG